MLIMIRRSGNDRYIIIPEKTLSDLGWDVDYEIQVSCLVVDCRRSLSARRLACEIETPSAWPGRLDCDSAAAEDAARHSYANA